MYHSHNRGNNNNAGGKRKRQLNGVNRRIAEALPVVVQSKFHGVVKRAAGNQRNKRRNEIRGCRRFFDSCKKFRIIRHFPVTFPSLIRRFRKGPGATGSVSAAVI